MTLGTRAWVTAATLLVLAVAGEFVGAARRRILRRRVPEPPPPTLAPGQLHLKVRGPDGYPVPHGTVTQLVWSRGAGPGRGTRKVNGMVSGSAVLGPLEGEESVRWLEVSAAADTAEEPLPYGAVLVGPVPAGATSFDVALPAERILAGSIRRGGGPLSGVKVRARLAHPPELASFPGGESWHGQAVTGQDGSFLLGRLGEGAQDIAFECPQGFAIAGRRVEGGAPLDIDLDAGASYTVVVTDRSGNPLGNAVVSVMERPGGSPGSGRLRARGLADWTGRIRFHGLPGDGRFRLVVVRPGTGAGIPGEESEWDLSAAAGETTVRLRNQRTLAVRVVDEKRVPHAGVAVLARPDEPGRPAGAGVTGQDGRCVLRGLDAGPVHLTVTDACSIRAAETVAQRDVGESESEVLLTMPRGDTLAFKLVYGSGAWTEGLRAVLREEGTDAAAAGAVRFAAVSWHGVNPASSYAVTMVDPPWNQAVRIDGIRPAGGVKSTTATLVPALPLAISVRWPAGAVDREVHAAWGTESAGKGEELPDHTWRIPCLPAGKYVVRATCSVPGRAGRAEGSVEADAGGDATIQVR